MATLDRRYRLAAIVLLVGSLCHETALIMGVPLCAAFWFLDWRDKQTKLSDGVWVVGVLLFGVIVIAVLERVFGADLPSVARTIANAPHTDRAPWLNGSFDLRPAAAYMLGGGLRTLAASNCQMYAYPGAYIFVLSCFASIPVYILVYFLRSRLALLVFTFVSLLPMVFLSIVAIDYGRWLALAVVNGWLATAGMAIRGWVSPPSSYTRYAIGLLAVVGLACLGTTEIPASSSRIWVATMNYYGPDLQARYLPKCDPNWLRVAHGETFR